MKNLILALVLAIGVAIPENVFSQVQVSPSSTNPEHYKNFLTRYGRLIDDKTRDNFQLLKTDKERELFIDLFWKERDTDPSTEFNEFKDQYDKRIDDIEKESLASSQDLGQFLFKLNGGLDGDSAWVYLLFGQPFIKSALLDDGAVTDLMVWIYTDAQGGAYRFLFYKERGLNQFKLFTFYGDDFPSKLQRISRSHLNLADESGVNRVYQALVSSRDGGLFLDALSQFSTYNTYPEKELQAPLPAAIIAKKAGVRIVGLSHIPDPENYVLSDRYRSMFTAFFRIGSHITTKEPVSYFMLQSNETDWRVVFEDHEKKAEAFFKVRYIFVSRDDRKVYIYENYIRCSVGYDKLPNIKSFTIIPSQIAWDGKLTFKGQMRNLSELPAGKYRLDVYIRNLFSQKYFSDIVDYTRPF